MNTLLLISFYEGRVDSRAVGLRRGAAGVGYYGYMSGMLAYDSLAEPGTRDYRAYTGFVESRTEAHLSLIEAEIMRAGHDGMVEIAGQQTPILEAAREYRASEYGQILSRSGRWRHNQGDLSPEQHHLLLGHDAKILDHSLGNMRRIAQHASDRRRYAVPAPHEDLLGTLLLAELTHESSEADITDIISYGKDPATSMLEQMLNAHALEDVYADPNLFLQTAPVTDKRDLGEIGDEDLRAAEARFESITGRPSGMLGRDIRDIIAQRSDEETHAAHEHALVEKLATLHVVRNAWTAIQYARLKGSSRGVEAEEFEQDYAALSVSVITRNIGMFVAHAASSVRYDRFLMRNGSMIHEIFQEDPTVMRRMLNAPDEVLGNRGNTEAGIEEDINNFDKSRQLWMDHAVTYG